MPNTPAAVGAGMTAFTCTDKVTERQARTAERLLKAGGKVRQVENEHMIDVVTAVIAGPHARGCKSGAAASERTRERRLNWQAYAGLQTAHVAFG